VGVVTAPASVGVAAGVNFTGEMFPSTAYVVYITLVDAAASPNTSPVLAAVAISTEACAPCAAPKALAAGSCECVTPSVFTLLLTTTVEYFLFNKDAFRAEVAQQLGVATAQVLFVAWNASTQEGMLAVKFSILPTSAQDVATLASVNAAIAVGNITLGVAFGGVAYFSNVAAAGAPDTRIEVYQGRPTGGRTSPLTEDGRLPGTLIDLPETSNQARFRWKIWFAHIQCRECASECQLDQGVWARCTSPHVIADVGEGERGRHSGPHAGPVDVDRAIQSGGALCHGAPRRREGCQSRVQSHIQQTRGCLRVQPQRWIFPGVHPAPSRTERVGGDVRARRECVLGACCGGGPDVR